MLRDLDLPRAAQPRGEHGDMTMKLNARISLRAADVVDLLCWRTAGENHTLE